MNRPTPYQTPQPAQISPERDSPAKAGSKSLMVLFWAYVTIPLAWGVVNTLLQASKLFH